MTSKKQSNKASKASELRRLEIQVALDSERSALERNKWGQFATPPVLADDITRYTLSLLEQSAVRFLEPSCGSGSFFSSLLRSLDESRTLDAAIGVELDERFALAAKELWAGYGLDVVQGDFIEYSSTADYRANVLIANPPYVRHHHLGGEQKALLTRVLGRQFDFKVSGLTGLYVYFILLSHRLLAPDAMSAWLIPTEFMDVNYGSALRSYLTTRVSLLRVHRFDPADVQFDDALVSSAVVVFRNTPPPATHRVSFTYGGSVVDPRESHLVGLPDLPANKKWTRVSSGRSADEHAGPVISDFFKIRRGLATGSNAFFILPKARIDELGFKPENIRSILPSPRFMPDLHVRRGAEGWPLIEKQLGLIDSSMTEEELRVQDPALWKYLHSAETEEIRSGYLVKQRSPWYRQEQRGAAPFLCTYMGRGVDEDRPFRFIWNESDAVATNMFLMLYPLPPVAAAMAADPTLGGKIHEALLSLTGDDLRLGGRVYGGGLHKIEPKELAALPATAIAQLVALPDSSEQLKLM
jgi:adenine-specific DNA-methyltransferase